MIKGTRIAFALAASVLLALCVILLRSTRDVEKRNDSGQLEQSKPDTPNTPAASSAGTVPVESVELAGPVFSGRLSANDVRSLSAIQPWESPKAYNGFRELYYRSWPNRNLAAKDQSLLNWEFLLNGVLTDPYRNSMTYEPRRDYCHLAKNRPDTAALVWPSPNQSYGMDCTMEYRLSDKGVDLSFSCTLRKNIPNNGWIGFMWSSYIAGAIDRKIYFCGAAMNSDPNKTKDENPKALSQDWIHLGDGTESSGQQMGAVAHVGVPCLPMKDGKGIFVQENSLARFVYPFYYGLVDGDGDLSTTQDAMAWIMMFDQDDPIRFGLWNFSGNSHEPAWDWQYIIHNTQIDQTYRYHACVIYKPFVSPEDVMQEYVSWRDSLASPKP